MLKPLDIVLSSLYNEGAMEGRRPIELNDPVNQKKAAKLLNRSRQTIWTWINEGKLQPVIVGGLKMIPLSEIERIKKEQAAGSPTA